MPHVRLLILGGTGEARALAEECAQLQGVEVITSLAGRTSAPLLPSGEVRVGGFGGPDGLAAYLRATRVDAVVDATHPFAAAITASAVAASSETGVPLVVLHRPGWTAGPADDWRRVPSLSAAAAIVPSLGTRVFLTTGRQSIAAFAPLDRCWFLARSVEPPAPPLPRAVEVLLDRGPFTLDGERTLLAGHRIEVLVSKDSGGEAPKLAAAREARIPVVLVDRPALPRGVHAVQTIADALGWIAERIRCSQ